MDKDALLKQALKEYDDLAHANQDAFDIGIGHDKKESAAYWQGIRFGRDYLENWLRKCFKFLP